jgi:hypothetical protein
LRIPPEPRKQSIILGERRRRILVKVRINKNLCVEEDDVVPDVVKET